MSLIVIKNIKKLYQKRDLKVSAKALKALEAEVEKICLKSIDNTKADRLKVVQAGHIPSLDALLDSSPLKNFVSTRLDVSQGDFKKSADPKASESDI